MRYLKSLGLAAVATMALMAFLGAGQASATVLCKTELTENCAVAGWDYPAGTVIHATLEQNTSWVVETLQGTVLDTCAESTIKARTTNTGGVNETVDGPIQVWNFGECTKATNTMNPGSFEIHWIAGTDNGTLTISNTEITINTIFGTCVYGGGVGLDIGTIAGGKPATIAIGTKWIKIAGNAACPAETRLTASYLVTEPVPLYISKS